MQRLQGWEWQVWVSELGDPGQAPCPCWTSQASSVMGQSGLGPQRANRLCHHLTQKHPPDGGRRDIAGVPGVTAASTTQAFTGRVSFRPYRSPVTQAFVTSREAEACGMAPGGLEELFARVRSALKFDGNHSENWRPSVGFAKASGPFSIPPVCPSQQLTEAETLTVYP